MLIPLTQLELFTPATVAVIRGRLCDAASLQDLGLRTGAEVRVIGRSGEEGGTLLVASGGTRIGISEGTAGAVFVNPKKNF